MSGCVGVEGRNAFTGGLPAWLCLLLLLEGSTMKQLAAHVRRMPVMPGMLRTMQQCSSVYRLSECVCRLRTAPLRFDKFNLKYNPFGQSRLREIFIKQVSVRCFCIYLCLLACAFVGMGSCLSVLMLAWRSLICTWERWHPSRTLAAHRIHS